jgi:membrane-associated phospholipid phosphatase
MPIAVLITVSTAAGITAWAGVRAALRRWWAAAPASATAAVLQDRTPVNTWVRSRLEADVATGLALTLALVAMTAAGIVVAVLAVTARRVDALHDLDSAAALWAHRNDGPGTRRVLDAITTLAATQGVAVIAVVVGALELIRLRSWAIPAFLAVVTLGDSLVTNAIKAAVARARPAIEPVAATLGPSFPSGHSSTAAAFFAALALLAGRRRSARVRAALAGVAVAVAVAVACSRVMLDLHWVSDVVAGLALGWGWFAACAIAFGGWLLEFGQPVKAAARVRSPRTAEPTGSGD